MKSRLPPITGTPEYLQREYEKKGIPGLFRIDHTLFILSP